MRIAMSLFVLCVGVSAAGAEVVGLQWPENRVQQMLFAYGAAALMPVKPTDKRPTLEERLAAPPFVTGESRVGLELSNFDADAAGAIRAVAAKAGAGATLNFGTWSPVLEKLYGPHRAPVKLAALMQQTGLKQGPDWDSVDVTSLLTKSTRRIWYNARTVLESTAQAMETGQELTYPTGTWFMTEQIHEDGTLVEYHLLGKRADHELDYLLYDKNGNLSIGSAELNMRTPTTCFACHRNARRLSPFAEFPEAAAPMNGFTPAVHFPMTAPEKLIAKAFVLTGARPDDTHGTYGGIAAIRLRQQMAAGTAPAWGKALWPRLVKLVPALAL